MFYYWNYRWLEDEEIQNYTLDDHVIQPEGDQTFCYWWEDMRPKEIIQLIKDAYEAGYKRAKEEFE